ncbi:atrial natriuretic peptide receptor 3-like isoform X3 [Paramacrobiotus metropolitanus]|nr:atrial natriuretic peptide receptor 3-like isoform X3 [Paramacrobiotus metropolitanus]
MPYASLASSYDYYGPVTDMAIEQLNVLYPRFYFEKVNFISPSVRTCNDLEDIVVDDLYQYIRNKSHQREAEKLPAGVTVLSSAACSTALRWIGDLARELNLPLISSGGSSDYLSDPLRFPTMLRLLVYQQRTISVVMLQFLRRFNWTAVTLICDDNPSLGDFFILTCEGVRKIVAVEPDMNVEDFHFDSSRTLVVDYLDYLKKSAAKSRIIIIFAHGNRTRDIMVTANQNGMTNGNFVYITAYPMEHPMYGYMGWQLNDGHDDEAQEAYKSLYFVTPKTVQGGEFINFELETKYRAYQNYRFFYGSNERVSAFTALEHTAVLLAGKFINETDTDWEQISDRDGKGREIMEHALQRQKVSSVTGDFILDHGDRELYVYVVIAMNHITYGFDEVFSYDTIRNQLMPSLVHNITWVYRNSPPPNRPECGFDHISDNCHVSKQELTAIYCGVAIAAIVLGSGLIWFARRTRKTTDTHKDSHWYISYHDLIFDNPEGHMNGHAHRDVAIFKKSEDKRRDRQPLSTMTSVHSSHVSPRSVVTYRGRRLWLHKVPCWLNSIPLCRMKS